MTSGDNQLAIGEASIASSQYGADTAVGTYAHAYGSNSSALGTASQADGYASLAVGGGWAQNDYAISAGSYSQTRGVGSIALGSNAMTGGQRPTPPGSGDPGDPGGCLICVTSKAAGASPDEDADYAIAIGQGSRAFGTGGIALGNNAMVLGANSVALGQGSLADRDNSVSVGAAMAWTDSMGGQHAMLERQITNVAAGSDATDAVNVGQLTDALAGVSGGASQNGAAVAAAFGGGATYGLQGMTAPSYLIQGNAYSDVGGAFAALDSSLTGALTSIHHLEQQVDDGNGNGNGGHGPGHGHGNGVAVGDGSMATDGRDTAIGKNATIGADGSTAVGSNATIDATATNAVAIGADTHVSAPSATAVGQGASATGANSVALGAGAVAADANTVSVGSAALQRRVTNVAAGTTPTDAANVGQVDQALQTAKSYADSQDATTLGNAKAYTDQRFDSMKSQLDDRFRTIDRRVDRIGAMGAASTQMAINAAGASSAGGRVAVGAGVQGGERALSVGYATQLGERARMSIGGAFSGSENSAGIGFGVDL